MIKESVTRNFMTDPNQELRRAELAAFIGPNAEKFMPVYDNLRIVTAGVPGAKRQRLLSGFVGTAFLLGPTWFFYRKLWVWAISITVLELGLGFIPHVSRLGFPLSLALAFFAKGAYVDHAIKRVTALRGTAQVADLALLQREGGVSKVAGWLSGSIVVLIMLAGIASIIYLAMHNGGPPGKRLVNLRFFDRSSR